MAAASRAAQHQLPHRLVAASLLAKWQRGNPIATPKTADSQAVAQARELDGSPPCGMLTHVPQPLNCQPCCTVEQGRQMVVKTNAAGTCAP